MTTKSAINRLTWRLKKGGKGNSNDADALNCLINYINKQNAEVLKNNQLYAKLYIYFLNQKIKHYNTTVFDKVPQKELSRLLDMPLEIFFQSFQKSFNQNMFEQIMSNNGIEIKHPTLGSNQDKKFDTLKIEKMSREDVDKIIKDVYSIETIENNLTEMINESLLRFN